MRKVGIRPAPACAQSSKGNMGLGHFQDCCSTHETPGPPLRFSSPSGMRSCGPAGGPLKPLFGLSGGSAVGESLPERSFPLDIGGVARNSDPLFSRFCGTTRVFFEGNYAPQCVHMGPTRAGLASRPSHPAISAMKMISRERAGSNGPASQSPKTLRTARPERAIIASTCSREGKRSGLFVVSVACGRR